MSFRYKLNLDNYELAITEIALSKLIEDYEPVEHLHEIIYKDNMIAYNVLRRLRNLRLEKLSPEEVAPFT